MDNNVVGFIEYKGTKESLLSNTTIKDGDIVFGYDETSDISYIYHNGVFYSNTSELSEVLPEIYIGDAPPLEGSSAVVWYQTNVDIPDSPTEEVSWEDINNRPEFADVAFTGNFNDLVNIPDFNLTKESCTVYAYTYEESSYAPFTEEQRESNADAFIKIRQALSDKKDINITVIVVYESKENIEYRDCYITDAMYSNITSGGSTVSVLIGVEIESATIIQDINKPYLSHVKVKRLGNDAEYPSTAGSVEAVVTNTYLATDKDLDKHTTTYIGTDTPTNSKYNLWVDTSDEEVVFKYKEGNEWKVLSTGGSGSIEVDTLLDPISENPIANKAVYELATVIGEDFEAISKDLLKKASTENGLVEGRGFKVNDNLKYYLPNTTTTTDPTVDDTHIIATKADVLSNEVIDNKATVYNLYAMDELTAEQLAANEAALVSVQNREVAIYKVYTNDDTYAIADVKLVPGPILEAYVYVNNPDIKSKQATIIKYTYTFDQSGEYTTSDKEEVTLPSIDKVNELIGSGGGGSSSVGGLETRIVYIPNYTSDNSTLTDEEKEYNLETCHKLLNGTARAALSLEGETAGVYALNTYCEDILDLSALGEEGYYIPFKWTYMVQLGATIIGNDGDILLFGGGGGESVTVSDLILNKDLSNLGDIGSAAMEQYSGGKLPTVYYVNQDLGSLLQLVPLHPFGTFSTLGVMLQGIGESLDNTERTIYNLNCYNPATNTAHTFEATPIATKIYIGKPSTEHKNINKAFANKPFGVLGTSPMPAIVYEDSSSAEILRWKSYQPLEKYIVPNLDSGDWGDYTHIEFLIFREGKYERWKLDMEGETSLIE